MESILRGAAIYIFLLFVIRISGKRTLSEITTFDFVLILIIGEATQQALLGDDFSLINSALVIITLVGLDRLMAQLKSKYKSVDTILEGRPLVLMSKGELLEDRMKEVKVDRSDILKSCRESHGVSDLDKIDTAVLEKGGAISIILK